MADFFFLKTLFLCVKLSGELQTSCACLVRICTVIALRDAQLYSDWSSNISVCGDCENKNVN